MNQSPLIFVDYNDIKIPENRYRKQFPEQRQQELSASVARIGLLHPLTVQRDPSDDKFWLRAGERRLRVLKGLLEQGAQLRIGESTFSGSLVPVIEYDNLSPREQLEVEVEENVTRLDFDFRERAAALAALHELRTSQNPAQTVTDTAEEALGRPASTDI